MRPLALQLCAIGPYEKELHLDFSRLADDDFLLIHGATGAGKTSIFDAICYALYGKGGAMEGRSPGLLRNKAVPPDVDSYVEFTFSINGEIYRIHRIPPYWRRPKRGKGEQLVEQKSEVWLKQESGESPIKEWSNEKDVAPKIRSLLGFDCEQFRQVVLLPQGQFQKFLMADTGARKDLMQVIFNTGLYERVEEKMREKARLAEKEAETNHIRCQSLLQGLGAESGERLASLLSEQQKQIRDMEAGLAILKKAGEEAQAARAEGEKIFAAFQEADEAARSRQEILKLVAADEATGEKLARAEKAAGLHDLAVQLRRTEAEYSGQQQKLARLVEQGKSTRLAKEEAEKAWEQAQAGEPKLKEAEAELVRLKALTGLVSELSGLEQQARLMAEKGRLKEKAQREMEADLKDLREKLEQCTKEHETAMLLGAKCESASLTAESLQQALQRAEKRAAAVRQLTEAQRQETERERALANSRAVCRQGLQELQELRELEQLSRAALLAEGLEEGTACPVCGAEHHPRLAKAAKTVTIKAIKEKESRQQELEKQQESLRERWQETKEAVASAQASLQELSAEGDERSLESLQEALHKARQAKEEAEAGRQRAVALAGRLQQLRQAILAGEESLSLLRKEAGEAGQEAAKFRGEVESKRRQLPEGLREPEALPKAIAQKERAVAAGRRAYDEANKKCQSLLEKYARVQADYRNGKELEKKFREDFQRQQERWEVRLAQAGFESQQDYLEAGAGDWQRPEYREQVKKTLEEHQQALHAVRERCARAEAAIKGLARPEMEKLNLAASEAEKLLQARIELLGGERKKLASLLKGQQDYEVLKQEGIALDQRCLLTSSLAEYAKGARGQHISFQSYVLHYLLEEVMQAANLRLERMSRGQYRLVPGERSHGKAQGGLDMAVFDSHAGCERKMATLSGGESFLASLSLALGLADVIQAQAGGIHLDTMFIDEGFGTLDSETLDTALKVLMELSGGGRLVGIISHVEELKSRIPARLEVRKERQGGSTARFVFGTEEC